MLKSAITTAVLALLAPTPLAVSSANGKLRSAGQNLACGVPFGLRTDFDPIRRFIRYGEIGEEQLVVGNVRPALTNWMTDAHLVEEHVVAFAWVPPNGLDFVGQITLFNFMSYNVMLARGYGGLVRPTPKGLRYDIRTRRVRPLIRL